MDESRGRLQGFLLAELAASLPTLPVGQAYTYRHLGLAPVTPADRFVYRKGEAARDCFTARLPGGKLRRKEPIGLPPLTPTPQVLSQTNGITCAIVCLGAALIACQSCTLKLDDFRRSMVSGAVGRYPRISTYPMTGSKKVWQGVLALPSVMITVHWVRRLNGDIRLLGPAATETTKVIAYCLMTGHMLMAGYAYETVTDSSMGAAFPTQRG